MRLRDVLPGRYAFGVTGRGPARRAAAGPGAYVLRIVASPGRRRARVDGRRALPRPVARSYSPRVVRARAKQPMSATAAPTHLRENPFELARAQLRRVGETFGVDPNLIGVLSQCKKTVEVSCPSRWTTAASRSSRGTGSSTT